MSCSVLITGSRVEPTIQTKQHTQTKRESIPAGERPQRVFLLKETQNILNCAIISTNERALQMGHY